MRKWGLKNLRLIGTILSGTWAAVNLWGLAQVHIVPVGSVMINDPHFLGLFHFGGFALGIAVLVAINWRWVYEKTGRGKLDRIGYEARILKGILVDHAERAELRRMVGQPVIMRGMSESLVVANVSAIVEILDSHSIPYPSLDDLDSWIVFVSRLEVVARYSGSMKKARRLHGDLSCE